MMKRARLPLPVLFALSAACPAALADFTPSPGVSARVVFESPLDSTLMEGLSYDDGRLYTAMSSQIFRVNPDDTNDVVSLLDLPFNLSVSVVQRAGDAIYAAWSSAFTPPIPYEFGINELDSFRSLLTVDSIHDSAVNPAGELYLVADPGGTGARIYRFVPATTSLVEVVNAGGATGGIAFDTAGRLYYASQTSSRILRFTPAQLAAGSLGEADGDPVVVNVPAGYLALDGRNRLYATTDNGNALRVFDAISGRAYRTLAVDGASENGIRKLAWDEDRNRLFAIFSYFNFSISQLLEVLPPAVLGDADRDGVADRRVYHPASGTWYTLGSDGGIGSTVVWGGRDHLPVSGDFDGDARADIAVYNRLDGLWSILNSRDGAPVTVAWGNSAMTPVPGDYDGDGKTDIAVYARDTGDWFIRRSSDNQQQTLNWGWSEALAAPADYDGDGRTDLAVYHWATGDWYLLLSASGNPATWNLGVNRGTAVPADYDGDGQADLAVYQRRTGAWTIAPLFGSITTVSFGGPRGIPVPGDYDGDALADVAIYDVLTGDWHTLGTREGYRMQNWGWNRARPVKP